MKVPEEKIDGRVRRFPVESGWIRRVISSPGLWAIALVLVAAWFAVRQLDAVGGPMALRDRWGWFAAVPLVMLHAIVGVSPFPGETVALGNSMLFGFQVGAICNWCGWMLCAWIQYGLVRRATDDLKIHDTRAWKRLPAWLRSFPMEHPAFLIVGRWLPFGGHVVNISAGATPVPFWRHTWCAAVSILPVAILFAAIGTGAAGMIWPDSPQSSP